MTHVRREGGVPPHARRKNVLVQAPCFGSRSGPYSISPRLFSPFIVFFRVFIGVLCAHPERQLALDLDGGGLPLFRHRSPRLLALVYRE